LSSLCRDGWQSIGAYSAKINVISALKIQDAESLAPIAKLLTGVAVDESVPDVFLARADEIVDVEVSVGELRERLREGNIYPIQQMNLALRNFFFIITRLLRSYLMRRVISPWRL